jgi:glycerophosphoryl diester phosphodiesterase
MTKLYSALVTRAMIVGISLGLAACIQDLSDSFRTLDKTEPKILAHRGASGYLPEETLEAYQLAIDMGADAVETDLISTKDGVLIARHDPNLAISTDVASKPEFASRKRVDWLVDGEKQTGWFAHDFTLAEIKTLGAKSTDAERPQQFNGKYKIITFQELVDLVKAQSLKQGRDIAVYPETKNPTYHRDLGLPLEDKLVAIIKAAGWNSKSAPIYVQSFEPSSLKLM